MSAELLREAAEGMRGEFETDPYRQGKTMRAVADCLDCAAEMAAWYETSAAPVPESSLPDWVKPALAVARAYLGRAAR